MSANVRQFDTGATRDLDVNKFDYEGFISPLVLERYGAYMHKHRKQSDGKLRDSDNWQKGIPLAVYIKSGFRHFFDWWKEHRGIRTAEGIEDAMCALLFNVMGYLHVYLLARATTTAQPISREQAMQEMAEAAGSDEPPLNNGTAPAPSPTIQAG